MGNGLRVPESLDWLRGTEEGQRWLATLPGVLAACAAQWALRTGRPYPGSYVSLVVRATLPDGAAAVLKIQFPEPDSRHEAAALRAWDGKGAVRLLAHDEQQRALLMERCTPGAPLSTIPPEEALDVFVGLLPRMWRSPTPPFCYAAQEVDRWVELMERRYEQTGRPCERRLVDAAVSTLRELAGSQGEQVLLNQDLHVNNVLRARRERWLVIDPKPLIGERELAVACLVGDYGLGHSQAQVRHRLDRLTDELGLDRERARGWSAAKATLWAFQDDDGMTRHFETSRWLLAG